MAARNKPYEQFGSYILFKKLEADALGELYRAAAVADGSLGPTVALRRLTGGNREALAAAAMTAEQIVPSLTGPSFVREQRVEIINGIATVIHEYASGRSLRAIIDRARGTGATPNPLPIDQGIAIAERVAVSLTTTGEMRFAGERLVHGALIPQFVWIGDDGEIRVAGHGLGHGLVMSLQDEKVAAEIGRYLAPETQHSGVTSKSTEVYALGTILYLLVTGQEPPDATRTSAFTHAVRAAKTMTGTPVPDDVRAIIEKSLNIDPSGRYESPADMRAALSALSASGRYSATSFNLAFYLSTLLKKEMEVEAVEREHEAKVNVAAYAPRPDSSSALTPGSEEPARNRLPLAIAATVAIAAAGAGAWLLARKPQVAPPAAAANVAAALPAQARPPALPEPIVASPATTAAGTAAVAAQAPSANTDEAARKKAFEDAVKQRLQEEMLKLQNEYTRQLQQQQSRNAPAVAAPPPSVQSASAAPVSDEQRVASTVPMEQQRREVSRLAEQAEPAQSQTTPPVTLTTQTTSAALPPPTATVAPVPQPPAVREGDVVDMNELDQLPAAIREPRPTYPPMAARQRAEATIMATLLISENGEVLEVKILKGEPRFGFNEAAVRAFRGARYTSPMKDGKRVKTWVAQMIQFKP